MRRILSIWLLLVLGLGPAIASIPAAAFASVESRLPACCRRSGQHHCAMAGTLPQAGSETTIAANDPCPFAPQSLASTAPAFAAFLQPASQSFLPASERRAPQGVAHAARQSDRRSQPKRGPPALPIV